MLAQQDGRGNGHGHSGRSLLLECGFQRKFAAFWQINSSDAVGKTGRVPLHGVGTGGESERGGRVPVKFSIHVDLGRVAITGNGQNSEPIERGIASANALEFDGRT
jgi:hypothetical protein